MLSTITCPNNIIKLLATYSYRQTRSRRKMTADHILKIVKSCIPPLEDRSQYKGQAGRIGIIGGSLEYTGAPYFSGISALKVSGTQ